MSGYTFCKDLGPPRAGQESSACPSPTWDHVEAILEAPAEGGAYPSWDERVCAPPGLRGSGWSLGTPGVE